MTRSWQPKSYNSITLEYICEAPQRPRIEEVFVILLCICEIMAEILPNMGKEVFKKYQKRFDFCKQSIEGPLNAIVCRLDVCGEEIGLHIPWLSAVTSTERKNL